MKKILLLLSVFWMTHVLAFAEKPEKDFFSISVHAGYSNILSGTSGLTNSSSSYINKLSSGFSWDGELYYKHRKFLSGLFYSGYTSKGELTYSSDHIFIHYLGLQVGREFPITDKFRLRANGGFGPVWYRNNSTVYGKSRDVSGRSFGVNLGLNGIYLLSPQLGLSFNLQGIMSALYNTNIDYHGETIKVKYFFEKPLGLSRLQISLGLSYFFNL
jgi:hypothetical protein